MRYLHRLYVRLFGCGLSVELRTEGGEVGVGLNFTKGYDGHAPGPGQFWIVKCTRDEPNCRACPRGDLFWKSVGYFQERLLFSRSGNENGTDPDIEGAQVDDLDARPTYPGFPHLVNSLHPKADPITPQGVNGVEHTEDSTKQRESQGHVSDPNGSLSEGNA